MHKGKVNLFCCEAFLQRRTASCITLLGLKREFALTSSELDFFLGFKTISQDEAILFRHASTKYQLCVEQMESRVESSI